MQCRIITRNRTVNKSFSIVDAKLGMEGMTSGPSTYMDDSPVIGSSESTNVEEFSDRSPSNEVSDDIRVGQTSVGTGEVDTPTGPINERIGGTCLSNVSVNEQKIEKEQLKRLLTY